MNITVGTRVRSAEGWNKAFSSEGIVTNVDGDTYTVEWPDGLVYNNGPDLYKQRGDSDLWEGSHFEYPNPLLKVIAGSSKKNLTIRDGNVSVTIETNAVTVKVNGTVVVINR